MKVETIFASNSQVVMNIRIMLFIVMMMVMPVSYAACYSELSVQHNLVVQGDFALTQTHHFCITGRRCHRYRITTGETGLII